MAHKNMKELKAEKKAIADKAKQENDSQSVKMKFEENKFYKDPTTPHFLAGVVYEIKGGDQIQRWLKRGGEIVEGELTTPEAKSNPSEVVPNAFNEQKPFNNEPSETPVEGDLKEGDTQPKEDVPEISLDGEDHE